MSGKERNPLLFHRWDGEKDGILRGCAKEGHKATLQSPFLSAPGQLKLSIHMQGRRLKLYGKSVGGVWYRSNKPPSQEKRKPEAFRYDIDYPQPAGDMWGGGCPAHRYVFDMVLELPFISQEPGVHLPRLCGASDTISTWQQRPSCLKWEKQGCRCVFHAEDSSEETLNALAEGQDFRLSLKIQCLQGKPWHPSEQIHLAS